MQSEQQKIQECKYWQKCQSFVKKYIVGIEGVENNYNYCFCNSCHLRRKDNASYKRGQPQRIYELPLGFAGFGVKCQTNTKEDVIFQNWQNAFHGTNLVNINSIIRCKMQLQKPGEKNAVGETVNIRHDQGRIKADIQRKCPYTGKLIDHKVHRIFTTPCICYANYYSEKITVQEGTFQIILQTRINPEGSITLGPETIFSIKSDQPICKNGISNSILEDMLDKGADVVVTRILIKAEVK